jgi:hypothetical protein
VNWTRVAIVGTAQSYLKTPWTDPGLTILSLNDAYNLPAFKRADAWYDFHPIDKFFSAKKARSACGRIKCRRATTSGPPRIWNG